MTPLERLVTQALRLPIEIVQHIIRLNRDAAERAASTIFQKYTRGSRPRLAFHHMRATLGALDFGNNRHRARWWREHWYPVYDSTAEEGPGHTVVSGEARRQFVATYRRLIRETLQQVSVHTSAQGLQNSAIAHHWGSGAGRADMFMFIVYV
jgi:hypothetical protein